ncbi:class I SAM-dependent methyltransferase [Actinocorallia longicatena]|uniref:Class I SAM-dependent methyltransferase n=2 Tax=Actinocorallia longicatena TaxID=111803 RepID=A0ABP6QBK6_9ACTN
MLHPLLADVIAWIGELADAEPLRIADLGAGTGTGALALAERFPGAEIIAVDKDPEMLERLLAKHGARDRVRAVEADLDAALPDLGALDLVWAASSLHHLADPDRLLGEVLAALRPGGLLAAVEMDSFPRFLPDDIGFGRPGLEARCHAALAEGHAAQVPLFGDDWGTRLRRAGFAVEPERVFTADLRAPLPPAAGPYAHAFLSRLRTRLDDLLDAGDLAALDRLTGHGPESLLHRADLTVRAKRSVWAAKRPLDR